MTSSQTRLAWSLLGVCLLLAVAGCGGGSAETTIGGAVALGTTGQSAASAPDEQGPTEGEDEPSAEGRINPTLELCDISQLNEMASDLFPGHDVKCHPMPGKRTPTVMAQGATWTWGKVDSDTGMIEGSEDMMQVILDGREPRHLPGQVTDMPDLGESCPAPSESLHCDDKSLSIDGSDCLLRTMSGSLGDQEYTSLQMSCYIGRDSDTGLDVSSYTAATGVDVGDVEDFTAAAIDAARG